MLAKIHEIKQQLEVEGLPSIIEAKNDSRQEAHKQTLNSKTQIFHNDPNVGQINDPIHRKSLIDYPSYHNKSDTAQPKYKSFVEGASPRRHIPHGEDSSNSLQTFKNKQLRKLYFLPFIYIASYLKSILTDKHQNSELLISTIQQLYLKGVDSRQLAFLKLGYVKSDKEAKGGLKLSQFRQVFNTIMKQTHAED